MYFFFQKEPLLSISLMMGPAFFGTASVFHIFSHLLFVFLTLINAAKEGKDGHVTVCMDQNVKSSRGLA